MTVRDGVRRVQPGEGGGREEQEDRPGARPGRREGQQGGEAPAARGWRVREEHHRQADEDHPRDRVQSGGMSAVSACGVQQYHPEPHGDHQSHGTTQDRLQRRSESGELDQLLLVTGGHLQLEFFISTEMSAPPVFSTL